MNWKQEAMDKLGKYDAMRMASKNLTLELEQTALALQQLTPKRIAGITAKGVDDTETAYLRETIRYRELQTARCRVSSWLEGMDCALSTLSPEEKLILHRFYIYPQRGNVDRLCGELNAEQSSVYRRRDKALYKFTLALYGAQES